MRVGGGDRDIRLVQPFQLLITNACVASIRAHLCCKLRGGPANYARNYGVKRGHANYVRKRGHCNDPLYSMQITRGSGKLRA